VLRVSFGGTGWHNSGVAFVADDLGAWLIGLIADATRKKLTGLILGTEQERALRSAATAAIQLTAQELCPSDAEQAGQLAMVTNEVFAGPLPDAPLAGHSTMLEVLQAGIIEQLAVLDNTSLTGTGQSSADVLGIPAVVLADRLFSHLVREVMIRGSRGGPLTPLADQLNHDLTHLQGKRLEEMVGEVLQALARLDQERTSAVPVTPRWTAKADEASSQITDGISFSTVIQGRDVTVYLPHPAAEAVGRKQVPGHVFISYVHEDSDHVDRLQDALQAAGIPVWRDTAGLWPGEDWRRKIRQAITGNTLVFIACFSSRSVVRKKSYQNEELFLAIEQLRLRPPDEPWLIPVRFDDCEIPDWDIGGGRTLTSIQQVDLFGGRSDEGAARLVVAILRILQVSGDQRGAPGTAASGRVNSRLS
jgi:TIR domain-containing protein